MSRIEIIREIFEKIENDTTISNEKRIAGVKQHFLIACNLKHQNN